MSNRRGSLRMNDAEVESLLAGRHSLTFGTLGTDGRIHLVAMWYGFLNGHIAIETYPKSQKVVNLRHDPRVTVLVETGDSYESLRGVQVAGRAVIHEDLETVVTVCRSVIGRYTDGLESDMMDTTARELAHKRVGVEIVPEHVISWDHTKL